TSDRAGICGLPPRTVKSFCISFFIPYYWGWITVKQLSINTLLISLIGLIFVSGCSFSKSPSPIRKEESNSSRVSGRDEERARRGDEESGSRIYPVWYGTNRRPINLQDQSKGYSSQPDSINHYGKCFVVIPKGHQFGSVGSGWYQRWRKGDDRLS